VDGLAVNQTKLPIETKRIVVKYDVTKETVVHQDFALVSTQGS